MNKTPIGTKFVGELAKVNDQLCYLALLHHEFEATMTHHERSSPADFTSDIFPKNPFAARIYRRADELPTFGRESRTTAFRMAAIVGFEQTLAYLEEIQAFRAGVKPSPEDSIRADAPELQLLKRLEGWLPVSPKSGYFTTLGYCRHMRNSFAHGHDKPSKEFAAFAAQHSHSLNKFWKNGITELNGFDFKDLESRKLSPERAFAIMNLLRICVREIDSMIASTLTLEDLLQPIVKEIIRKKPDLNRFPSRVASKVRATVTRQYGKEFSIAFVTPLIEPLL
jgi:hypothetical protein